MINRLPYALLCALLLLSCGPSSQKEQQGYIEAENIYLASPYSGVLKVLAVVRGQAVKKGQFLFQLDKNPQEIALQEHSKELEEAKHVLKDLLNPRRSPELSAISAQISQVNADIELAKIRVNRYQKLYEKNAIDKDSLDAAITNLSKQEKLRDQYQANLDLAKIGAREEQIKAQQQQIAVLASKFEQSQWELEQKRISAPEEGVIFDTYFKEGEWVNAGQAVLSLLSPKYLYAVFFVPLDTLNRIQLHQKIYLFCENCSQKYSASIDYISPEAEYLPPLIYSRENNDKLVFRIKARLSNDKAFKPGQPVRIRIP